MKGVVLMTKKQGEATSPSLSDFDYESFPSVAFGSGSVQKKTFIGTQKETRAGRCEE